MEQKVGKLPYSNAKTIDIEEPVANCDLMLCRNLIRVVG